MGPGFQRKIAEHQVVGLDTPCFIYHFEQHPRYFPLTRQLFTMVEKGVLQATTSVLTLTEVMIYPLSCSREDLVEIYQIVFASFPNLTLTGIEAGTAEKAALLRAKYNLATPDALHLASALEHGATAFVSNDARLKKVDDLEILLLDDFVTP